MNERSISHAALDESTKATDQAGNQDIKKDMEGTGDDDQASNIPATTQEIVITSGHNTTITTIGGTLVTIWFEIGWNIPTDPRHRIAERTYTEVNRTH